MSSLIASYCAVLCCYPGRPALFLKCNGAGVDLGKMEVDGKLGGVEGGEDILGVYCIRDE